MSLFEFFMYYTVILSLGIMIGIMLARVLWGHKPKKKVKESTLLDKWSNEDQSAADRLRSKGRKTPSDWRDW